MDNRVPGERSEEKRMERERHKGLCLHGPSTVRKLRYLYPQIFVYAHQKGMFERKLAVSGRLCERKGMARTHPGLVTHVLVCSRVRRVPLPHVHR